VRVQQHDLVELWIELALVDLAAGLKKVTVVVAGEQIGDGLLAPYPVGRSVRQCHPVPPTVGIGIDSPVPP
jgi:hypothetical protein